MPIIRRSFPESFKREAVEQVIAGTPLRHVAQAIGVTEGTDKLTFKLSKI